MCIRSVDRHVLQTRGWHGDSSAVSMNVYDAACTVIYVSVKRGTGRAVARPASQCLSMGSRAICVRRARREGCPSASHPIASLVRLHTRRRSKQALAPAHRPPKAWESAGCIPGLSSRPPRPHTTHRCSRRLCAILSLATGVGDIHSFAIGRIHSFTYTHTHSLAHVQRHLTPYCLIPPTATARPPLKRLHTPPSRIAYTEFTSWLRHYSLGSRPRANQTITPRPRDSTPRTRTRRCCCPRA